MREISGQILMKNSGARVVKVVDIQADHVEGPGGRAIAAAEAAPHVLMRIDEEVDVMVMRLLDQRFDVVEIVLVITAGRIVLDRLPGDHQPQEIQPPVLEPQEVLIGFFQREGAADKRDSPALVGAVGQVRETGRVGRDFAAAAQVDSAQEACASRFVFEPASLGCDGHVGFPVYVHKTISISSLPALRANMSERHSEENSLSILTVICKGNC